MAKTLVVVESPAKAKTIKKYLGAKFEVIASKGHIKDLPKKLGIDIENGFQETYEVVPGKEKVLQELKAGREGAPTKSCSRPTPIARARPLPGTSPRSSSRRKKTTKRVEFHEITKKGVEYGVGHPRELDKNLYDAQRARRVLDRIVGYDVSALVWSKLAFGLSAGRVQSVALRLIVDREREIEAFVPEEYWNCGAALAPANGHGRPAARLHGASRLARRREARGQERRARRRGCAATSSAPSTPSPKITKSERKRNAPAPYTTSKLQQDAVNRLGFGAKRTMQIAQGLYEGVDLGKDGGPVGLITYMRTDSTRLSPDAVQRGARATSRETLRQRRTCRRSRTSSSRRRTRRTRTRPSARRRSSCRPRACGAHLKDDQFKLYKLIWERFVAAR